MEIIKKQKNYNFRGEVIAKIISSNYFVHSDKRIIDVANELTKLKDINCIGVVSPDEKILGILSREKIFSFIGKPYGKEVLSFKNVDFLVDNPPSFYAEENIISVVENVKDSLEKDHSIYFLVKSQDDKFVGIFSNIDLMIYLSSMLQKDIKLASDLQKSIVKEDFYEENENYHLLCHSNMAKEIGGDFYYFKENGNNLFISLCDVSGKGVSASLLTTFLAGEHFTYNFSDIKDFIINLNNDLFSTFQLQKFITAIFLNINTKTGKMKIYDMGHSLIYLIRNEKIIHLKTKSKNLPLGISKQEIIEENNFSLQKNDLLILLTDGLTEQINPEYEEFGIQRALKTIKSFSKEKTSNIRNVLLNELHSFRRNQPQSDDISFIIYKHHPSSSSSISSS
ncbi:MAG: SpoIIE family protein phosphatase [Brevinematales bacterium]|nr:SpoIIE family protein phosphatase [Brevinematales bacterium]